MVNLGQRYWVREAIVMFSSWMATSIFQLVASDGRCDRENKPCIKPCVLEKSPLEITILITAPVSTQRVC
jgi:hypothetical protein